MKVDELKDQLDRLEERDIEQGTKTLEKSLTEVHRHLMMLENYATHNYSAIQKVAYHLPLRY